VVAALLTAGAAHIAAASTNTTAWQNGAFAENTGGVVGRSDVVLGAPNLANTQSLPLGNGSLGVAEWAANGFTAQLNRTDTMPGRKSPGQLQIPGLAAMTTASNFTGTLDVYNGVLTESGGGMTMNAWVPAGKDELVVDVTGANPNTAQTATINLWSGRSPTAAASGAVGTLAETWVDNTATTGSGQTFGSLAAITAAGRNVAASVVNSESVRVSFQPNTNGAFRIVVGAPAWSGGNAATTATSLFGSDASTALASLLSSQSSWWNGFWAGSGLVEMSSADGSANYLESVRTLYLYTEAASMRGRFPGSQAGVADMFDFSQDQQDWYPAGTWFWNLRTQIATNTSSGNFALNLPIFDLYLNNLANLESWTTANMGGKAGICIPETMRYNGNGYQQDSPPAGNASCDLAASPTWNGETITTGAELSLWIWQQYLDTGDLTFLRKYYPLMQQSVTFLLAYQTVGSDGFLHAVANAHENQWNVQDPTTDLAADAALFPAEVAAATLLNTDSALVAKVRTAETEIEPYARTDESTHTQLLTPSADAAGTDVIGDSFQPTATIHNSENTGLEPVWPYGVITDNSGTLTTLANRTFTFRPNQDNPDWSFDAVQAARLDQPAQVQSNLITLTEKYQSYISGLGSWQGGTGDEPYIEQPAAVGTAIDEALATDYDGTLRIAPAWPASWTVAGTVSLRSNTKVDVQVQNGTITTAALVVGTSHPMTIRSPWSGQSVQIVDGSSGAVVVAPSTAATLTLNAVAGHSYLIEPTANLTTSLSFAQVSGTKAAAAKHLGPVQIGLDAPASFASLAASFDNVGISADTNTAPGNFDGNGASFSEQALTTAKAGPGATISSAGLAFTFPNVAAGTNDNTAAEGQYIALHATGHTLGFLVSGSSGASTGTGQVIYADGSTATFTLSTPDWFTANAPSGEQVAVNSTYQNRQGNTTYAHTGDIFAATVALDPTKSVATVVLPHVSSAVTNGQTAMHIFAMTVA
jgi:hypothetical protein